MVAHFALQTYLDGTLGAAGHAQALLQEHPVRNTLPISVPS
jgi:16S rRNA C1402 N4-methylase RsmH